MSKENSQRPQQNQRRDYSRDKKIRSPITRGSARARVKEDTRKYLNGNYSEYEDDDF